MLANFGASLLGWEPLFVRRLNDGDQWSQQTNIRLKSLLDTAFPVEGQTAEDIIASLVVFGDRDKLHLSAHQHIGKVIESKSKKGCCIYQGARATELDYLFLYDALSESNVIRLVYFELAVLGRAKEALKIADAVAPVFDGHPEIHALKSKAFMVVAKETEGQARKRANSLAIDNAHRSYILAQGQTPYSKEAGKYLLGKIRVYPFYNADFPRQHYWFQDLAVSDRPVSDADKAQPPVVRNLKHALKYTIDEFDYVAFLFAEYRKLSGNDSSQIKVLIENEEKRFVGHPDRASYIADYYYRNNEIEKSENILRGAIDSLPLDWNSYIALAEVLIAKLDYKGAEDLMKQYPGFKSNSRLNKVGLSHDAYQAGGLLLSRCKFEEAKHFFEISAGYQTGSGASMHSAAFLKTIEGDYAGSALTYLQNAKRYNDRRSYDKFISYLFAFGYQDLGESLLRSLSLRFPQAPWSATAVQARKNNLMLDELQRLESALADEKLPVDYLIGITLNYLLIDREIDEVALKEIDKVSSKLKLEMRENGDIYAIPVAGEEIHVGPGDYPVPQKMRGMFNKEVDSPYQLFSRGYFYLEHKNYEAAAKEFERFAALYKTRKMNSYILPYLAWALVNTGNTQELSRYLSTFMRSEQGGGYFLAKAILSMGAGNHNDALHNFELAVAKKK